MPFMRSCASDNKGHEGYSIDIWALSHGISVNSYINDQVTWKTFKHIDSYVIKATKR